MSGSLIWISGASSGLGAALAGTVPWENARVIGISRRPPAAGVEHLEADLSDPSVWPEIGTAFEREVEGFEGDRVVFIQAAGSLDPIGYAGEVDSESYCRSVVLNSAAPQVLGHLFIKATAGLSVPRLLVTMTSGAAKSVYRGWASYGAAKAGIDQWVRDVGAEQDARGGLRVISIAPGTVDTDMQKNLRETDERDFPSKPKFVNLHAEGKLMPAPETAAKMWSLMQGDWDNGSVIDLRSVE